MKRILIFDTASDNCLNIQSELEKKYSYSVKLITETAEMNHALGRFEPDLILCGNGFGPLSFDKLISQIKQVSSAPVLPLLSAKEALVNTQHIKALCTDFICTPVRIPELIARLELHSEDSSIIPSAVFTNGALLIDHENCKIYLDGNPVHLTMLEYKLICLLAKNCGSVVTYESITNELWQNCVGSEIRSLRVIVTTIRRKLKSPQIAQNIIQTHMGIGYCMPIYLPPSEKAE